MHVLHYLAVEADSNKDAFNSVKSKLEECSGPNFWSDWHVVGGGRWSKNSKDGYTDTVKDVLSYVKDKKKFDNALQWSKNARKDEMKSLLDAVQKSDGEATFMSSALSFIKNGDSQTLDMNAYNMLRIAQYLLGHWNCNSYYYDLESGGCSYEYLDQRLKDNPDSQYLVPVDFHF